MEHMRVNNDTYGNPRYVIHFLDFLDGSETGTHKERYNLAHARAKKLGGRVYTGKCFGGGFVFQCYSLPELEKNIKDIITEKNQ